MEVKQLKTDGERSIETDGERSIEVWKALQEKGTSENALPLPVHDLSTSPTHIQLTMTHKNTIQNLELEPQIVSAS